MPKGYRLTITYWNGAKVASLRSDLDASLAMGDNAWLDSEVKSIILDDILIGVTIKTWRS